MGSQQTSYVADAILVFHFIWAGWMVGGAVLAILGFRWPRLWGWCVFRLTHLIAFMGTASTPLWAHGICPLTTWESRLRAASYGQPSAAEPFIIHWINEVLFVNIDPLFLSLISTALALITLLIFILRPPWRFVAKRR